MAEEEPRVAREFIPPGGTGSAAYAFDWAKTGLGPRTDWPAPLKAAAQIVLGSNVPMMIGWGPDLLLVHNDSYGERVLGDRRPALGRPLREVWADQWDEIGAYVERLRTGETLYQEDLPRRLRRGGKEEVAWITACYSAVDDGDGQIGGIFGVVIGVADDAREQARIRESEARFRLIADSAPAMMWVTQLDRRRSFVNRAYTEFLGISYEEAVDFDWRGILHPDDQARVLAESLAGEATLKPFSLEARFHRVDGSWRWVRSISQPRWGPAGEHVGFIGVAHDIDVAKRAEEQLRELNESLERRVAERTEALAQALDQLREQVAERQRAEEALRQAQKMEAVGRLTGGIAHDFNNLLTPVIGGLEIITSKLEDPRLLRLAQGALDSSRRGAKLTSQLLTFSRLQRIQIAPVAVDKLIDNLRHILHHTIGPDVEIRTELEALQASARCDENQLENAILNLAINARDAMPDGGILTIRTERVTEAGGPELEAGDYVRIIVADTGIGMPPEVAARAIEPFFSTKPLGKGTGLGLAQVYGIARQAGGALRIESEPGKGCRMSLLLPFAPADSLDDAPEALASTPVSSRTSRILLVDDDEDVRDFIRDLLKEMGHDVEAAEAAEPALALIERRSFDLALIDFAMPGMNGAELARRLRQLRPSLPIAFLTGFAESEQLEDALGADVPVLRKPFGTDALASLIDSLVQPKTDSAPV